ncbi:MAG: peptidoglycan-binding protein LysM [Burkholderiales bacterium]
MGMFSFLKDIGEKLFGSGSAQATVQASNPAQPTDAEIAAALRAKVEGLGLDINGLDVTFGDGTAYVQGTTSSQAVREKVILAVGNSMGVSSVHDNIAVEKPEPEAQFYEVAKGDTLSKIAKHFYGDASKYPVIFEANKPMLTHPDKIYPGQKLRIPAA